MPNDTIPLPEPDGSAEANQRPHPGGGYEYDEVPAWSEPLVRSHAAAVSAAKDAEIAGLQKRIRLLEQMVCDAAYTLEGARILGGMDWSYNPLHPFKYRPMLDCLNKERERINAARAVLSAAPVVREPLSVDEIAEMWADILMSTPENGIHEEDGLAWHRLARAIEQAHGIGTTGGGK